MDVHSSRRQELANRATPGWPERPPVGVAEIFSGLSKSEAQAIMNMAQDQTYARRATVYAFGEHQRGLYLAKRGLIEEFRLTEGGNKLPISRIVPGQLFGLSSVNGHYCCFAEAVEESVVGLLSFEKLESVCRDFPVVAANLVKMLAEKLGQIEERLELVSFSVLRARVAWALLGLSASHGLRLAGITHEALADWAGGSRPKVSQVLEKLQQVGLVRLSRGDIQICDAARLTEWAKQEAVSL